MGSLTAHLVEVGDHGRLRFHPSCPVCRRERLFGTLSSEPVVPRRAQALIAGGVLAFSTAAPAAGLATEPDRQLEGVAAPDEPGGPELDDPGFDPGGDTALPFETAPAPAAPGNDEDAGDGAPLDVEPGVDLDARLAPLVDAGAPATGEIAPVPPADAVPPAEAVPPPGSLTPGESSDPSLGAVAPAPPAERPSDADGRPHRAPSAHGQDRASSKRETGAGGPDAGGPPPTQPVDQASGAPAQPYVPSVAPEPAPAAQPVAVVQANGPSSETSDDPPLGAARFHVVEPGDSLWSIAKRLLGRDASVARIAREVNRLWSLNQSRIATGDPDLLLVGTRLELR